MIDRLKDIWRTRSLAKRSSQWPAVRARHLKAHPSCAACGGVQSLQVHHKQPYHLFPALELNPDNLITLCEYGDKDCHLKVGHGPKGKKPSWKIFNPQVEHDAALLLGMRKEGLFKP
jgi:5-methylcytosine-specific restriction protein A